MKIRTLEKLILEKVFPPIDEGCVFLVKTAHDVRCSIQNNGILKIQIMSLTDRIPINYNHMEKLSQILKTKEINIGEGFDQRGCDTCDHGAEYWIVFTANNLGINLENK